MSVRSSSAWVNRTPSRGIQTPTPLITSRRTPARTTVFVSAFEPERAALLCDLETASAANALLMEREVALRLREDQARTNSLRDRAALMNALADAQSEIIKLKLLAVRGVEAERECSALRLRCAAAEARADDAERQAGDAIRHLRSVSAEAASAAASATARRERAVAAERAIGSERIRATIAAAMKTAERARNIKRRDSSIGRGGGGQGQSRSSTSISPPKNPNLSTPAAAAAAATSTRNSPSTGTSPLSINAQAILQRLLSAIEGEPEEGKGDAVAATAAVIEKAGNNTSLGGSNQLRVLKLDMRPRSSSSTHSTTTTSAINTIAPELNALSSALTSALTATADVLTDHHQLSADTPPAWMAHLVGPDGKLATSSYNAASGMRSFSSVGNAANVGEGGIRSFGVGGGGGMRSYGLP
jgi:hypothetical protein